MSEKEHKLGAGAYVVGGMSFIPLLGIVFGIVSIIWGLITKKSGGKTLALIGALGILFTMVLYGSLFFFGFVQRGGVYDDLRKQLAETTITPLVQSIEYYKVQNGSYPPDLETLHQSLPKDAMVIVVDPSKVILDDTDSVYFYYENLGDTYYLLGTGMDGLPFTDDDILPKVAPRGNVGFRVKGQ